MKSLRRCTPEVRTSKSRGGAPLVNIWSVRVFAVMFSGSGNVGAFAEVSPFSEGFIAVDVPEVWAPSAEVRSFVDDDGDAERDNDCSASSSGTVLSCCCLMFWLICVLEKGRFDGDN